MWFLIFLFGIATLGLGWICFAYYIFIWFVGLFRKEDGRVSPPTPAQDPFLSVIVPCFNEKKDIVRKIDNLKQQDYPKDKLEILFADGGSDDGTQNIIKENIKNLSYMHILDCPKKGKINQMNHALSKAKGDIIFNTDVDGIMENDCLSKIVEEFDRSNDIAVVGAYCFPKGVSEVDEYYWLSQNKGRLLETSASTSSIIIAVCYAFRKDLLSSIPEDVVADDIYVAYLSNTLGFRTIYSTRGRIYEIRGPKHMAEFMPHKFRKSNAFLKETLRFSYRIPQMSGLWQTIFITKLAQLLLLPWVSFLWVVLAVCLLSISRLDVVFLAVLFLLSLLVITSKIFNRVYIPEIHKKYSLLTVARAFIVSNIILFATGISYPFYRQDSSYSRLNR